MVAGGDSPLDMEEYLLVDERNNALLGMQYKDTKSGICTNNFVFCEEYWLSDSIANKDCLFTTALVGARYANSPFMAKEYAYSILLSCTNVSQGIINALRDTQAHVGYEFHEEEYSWPYLFGGWLPMIKEGLDHSITWYDGDLRAQAGYWASQVRIRPKGTLSEKPTMALSRKIGMRLVAEQDAIPNWIDLIPLMGTRRTLKRHYRRAQTDYKAVFREYLLLAKLRLKKFNDIMNAKIEFKSPLHEWLKRHPNSVWLRVFPNMDTDTPVGRVDSPSYGFRDQSFEMKLLMMKHQGYLDAISSPGRVTRGSQITLAESGVLTPCEYKYLPVGARGLSLEILKTYYPGFLPWYQEYGRVPVSLWDGDYPLECTRLWPYLYRSSLITLVRTWKYLRPMIQREISTAELIWMAQIISGVGKQEAEVFDPDIEPDPDIKDERSLIIENLVRDVVRDWFPNADQIIEEMRSRILPLHPLDRPVNYSYLIDQHLVIDPFSLVGDNQSTGINDPINGDDDEVYDPWSELGV